MLQTLVFAVNTSGLSAAPELSSTHQYSGGGVTANQNRLWPVKSWLFRGRMWALSLKWKLLWLSPRRCYYNKEKQFKKNSCPFLSYRAGLGQTHTISKWKRLLLELKTLEILTIGVFVSTHNPCLHANFSSMSALCLALQSTYIYLTVGAADRKPGGLSSVFILKSEFTGSFDVLWALRQHFLF